MSIHATPFHRLMEYTQKLDTIIKEYHDKPVALKIALEELGAYEGRGGKKAPKRARSKVMSIAKQIRLLKRESRYSPKRCDQERNRGIERIGKTWEQYHGKP